MTRPLTLKRRGIPYREASLALRKKRQEEERNKFDAAFQELGKGVRKSLNCYATRLNNNFNIFGPSGSGKTRCIICPMLSQMVGSGIISDPKAFLSRKFTRYLKRRGYKVVRLSLINPETSVRFNPLVFAKTDEDIIKLSRFIIFACDRKNVPSNADPFWDIMAEVLLSAVISLVIEYEGFCKEDKNLCTVDRVLANFSEGELENDESGEYNRAHWKKTVDSIFRELRKQKGEESLAWRQYCKLMQFKDTKSTFPCVLASAQAAMEVFEGQGTKKLISGNDIDFRSIADEKTVVFLEVSDSDRSKDGIANIFYSQALNELCNYADSFEDGGLPIPVRFVLDDFATNVKIPDFDKILSNIRSRRISAILACQSESQLRGLYGDAQALTILENCDTTMYLGSNHPENAEPIARRANIPVHKVLTMKLGTAWLFIRGTEPKLINLWSLQEFLNEMGIDLSEEEQKER